MTEEATAKAEDVTEDAAPKKRGRPKKTGPSVSNRVDNDGPTYKNTSGVEVKPFTPNMMADIRAKAQATRGQGMPTAVDLKSVPQGRFGQLGSNVMCANIDCQLPLLVGGTYAFCFTSGAQNGKTLCVDCACDYHEHTEKVWNTLRGRLEKQFGKTEINRVTRGQPSNRRQHVSVRMR